MKILYIIFLFLLTTSETHTQEAVEVSNIQTENVLENISNTSDSNNPGFLDAFYTGTNNTIVEPEQESGIFILLRIMLITGMLGLLTWVIIKFFFRKNVLPSTGENIIEILATVPAGAGVYFLVAKLGNLYYLTSLSPDGIRLLDKITDQEAIDFIELNRSTSLPQNVKFIDLLEQLPEGKAKKALEFLRDQIDKLKQK
ncbi:MAG: flagellar biosynthetic protein FliO [Brevinemataceae bacterium]